MSYLRAYAKNICRGGPNLKSLLDEIRFQRLQAFSAMARFGSLSYIRVIDEAHA